MQAITVVLGQANLRRQRGEGPRLKRQAALQRADQLAFDHRQLAAAVRVAERDRLAGGGRRRATAAPPRPALRSKPRSMWNSSSSGSTITAQPVSRSMPATTSSSCAREAAVTTNHRL